jgi:hypothetical protein
VKIDHLPVAANGQHRLAAEQARKLAADDAAAHVAADQQRLATPSAAPASAEAKQSDSRRQREASARSNRRRQGAAGPRGGAAGLQSLVSQVHSDFQKLGIVPPPARFAGLNVVSPAELLGAGGSRTERQRPRVTAVDRAQMMIIRRLLRRLTNETLQVRLPQDIAVGQADREGSVPLEPARPVSAVGASEGWAVALDRTEGAVTDDYIEVRTNGILQTADGEEVGFVVDVDFGIAEDEARQAASQPLVVAFDGPAEQLTQRQFRFRVDLARPPAGGALSGAPPVVDDLRVWAANDSGEEALVAVGQRDAGAIYIGHLTAPSDGSSAGDSAEADRNPHTRSSEPYEQPRRTEAADAGAEEVDLSL